MLDVASTQEELNEKETYYIKKYDSYKNGYNQSFGGDSMSGYDKPSGKDCPNSKRICQISLDGNLIKIWDCASDAHRELNIDQSSISMVCSGKRKTAGGFVWIHEIDYDSNKDYKRIPQKKDMGRGTKPVLWLDDAENVIKEFYSLNSVCDTLDICPQSVSDICNHKVKNGKYNLVFKSEYIGEQRLNVKGSAA